MSALASRSVLLRYVTHWSVVAGSRGICQQLPTIHFYPCFIVWNSGNKCFFRMSYLASGRLLCVTATGDGQKKPETCYNTRREQTQCFYFYWQPVFRCWRKFTLVCQTEAQFYRRRVQLWKKPEKSSEKIFLMMVLIDAVKLHSGKSNMLSSGDCNYTFLNY